MNSLGEVKLDHVYQLTRPVWDAEDPANALGQTGDVVVAEEIDQLLGVVIVRHEKGTLVVDPDQLGLLGIENFELEPPVKPEAAYNSYRKENGKFLIYWVPGIGFIVWDKIEQRERSSSPSTSAEADAFLNEVSELGIGIEKMAMIRGLISKHYAALADYGSRPGNMLEFPRSVDELDIAVINKNAIYIHTLGKCFCKIITRPGKLTALQNSRGQALVSFPVTTLQDFLEALETRVKETE